MTRHSFKWLLCLLLGLALAQPMTVVAIDHHENEHCLFTETVPISEAIENTGSDSSHHHDDSHTSECCMPCGQCTANLALLIEDVAFPASTLPRYLVNWLPAPRVPFDRPPRV